ncbi:MAG: hypothetical protein HYU67_02660 [Flavobacteriia bacterium]|nr:hypothetical protein [Flavobacteriia bacterium]
MEQNKWKKYLKIMAIVLVISTLVFILFYKMNSSNRILQNEREILKNEIVRLKTEVDAVNKKVKKTRFSRDSLYHVLLPYMPYESMVKSTAQRDSIARLLPFKYGEAVVVMPDSVKGIIDGIVYGGNQFESYVKFKVLLKDQKYVEVLPTHLQSLNK